MGSCLILRAQANNDQPRQPTRHYYGLNHPPLKIMSTAAERAAARRRAIMNRGTDRLAKLTSSARGEDATYLRDGMVDLFVIR